MWATMLLILAGPPERAPMPRPAAVALTADVAKKLQLIAFQACRDGDLETLKAFFAAGRPVNDTNARGDTLLTVAAYAGQAKAVALVLAQPKVDVDAKNGMGLTALAAAAFKGQPDIAKALLKAKANANAANGSGQTALMFAALAGKVDVAKVLLDAGADAKAADKAGNTPLSLARTQGADDVAKLLEAHLKR